MIDFGNLNKTLRAYDVKQVVAALDGADSRDPEVVGRFVSTLRESSSLVVKIQDKVKETHRDELVVKCREWIGSCPDPKLIENFENHIDDAKIAELGYRELFQSLRKSEIWKCSSAQQAWGMLFRAEREFAHVEAEIQKQMAKFGSKKGPPFDPRQLKLRDENGHPVNPDAVINGIVRNASETLVMLAHVHAWFEKETGAIVLPVEVSVDDKTAYKAGMYSLASCQWRYLEQAWDRSRFFNARFRLKEEEFKIKQGGTRRCTMLEVQSATRIELMDHVALHRVEQSFFQSQLGFEISGVNRKDWVRKNANPIPLAEAGYLTPEERASVEVLASNYCIPVDDESVVASELPLKVWMRGYAYFGQKARDAEGNPRFTCLRLSADELLNDLKAAGLSEMQATTFLTLTTFGRGVADLFDAPLLKISDGSYFFFAPAYQTPVLGVIVLSRLSSLNRRRDEYGQPANECLFENKGELFEKRVLDLFAQVKIPASGFRYKVDGVDYNCDVAALIEDTLYVFECKNRSLPMGHTPSLYYFNLGLKEAQQQVKRIVRQLTDHPDIVREHFGEKAKWARIVPVVLHALPWSFSCEDGVYTYDAPALAQFLREGFTSVCAISKVDVHHIVRRHRYQLRKGDILTADELEREMKEPVQLRLNTLGWKQVSQPVPISEDFVFCLPEWVQHEVSMEDQIIALGSSAHDAARIMKEMTEDFPQAVDKVREQFQAQRASRKIGRNARCPCGSDKKYKNCCLSPN